MNEPIRDWQLAQTALRALLLSKEAPLAVAIRIVLAGVANDLAERDNAIEEKRAPKLDEWCDAETVARWLQWEDPEHAHTADRIASDEPGMEPYDLASAWETLAITLSERVS